MPSAANRPIIHAITADNTASAIVVPKADMMTGLSNSSPYHLRVKPDHTTLERDELKLSVTSTSIGAYRNTIMIAI